MPTHPVSSTYPMDITENEHITRDDQPNKPTERQDSSDFPVSPDSSTSSNIDHLIDFTFLRQKASETQMLLGEKIPETFTPTDDR